MEGGRERERDRGRERGRGGRERERLTKSDSHIQTENNNAYYRIWQRTRQSNNLK